MVLANVDRELIQRCLDRQEGAWGEFVDRFVGLIVHVAKHSANTCGIELNEEEVEDLTAEVFLVCIRNDYGALRRFRGNSSLATYMTVVARRVIMHKLSRPRYRNRPRTINEVNSPSQSSSHEEVFETREQIESALSHLSGEEAEVIRLFHLEGKTYQEISMHIGMPENSVGPILSRARTKMRQQIE